MSTKRITSAVASAMPALRATALPDVLFQEDGLQERMLLAGKQFCRAVG